MNPESTIELFMLKCASVKLAVDGVGERLGLQAVTPKSKEAALAHFLLQFPGETRVEAERMAEHYKLFYMLENDIRNLIDETLIESYGQNWWDEHTPHSAIEECRQNRLREQEAGVTSRSDNPLHYVSFGQLGEIIRANWDLFGGILSNQKAMGRIMFGLNMLRGPIAHCGVLAEDEIDRLELAVKDWFRLLEGPKQA